MSKSWGDTCETVSNMNELIQRIHIRIVDLLGNIFEWKTSKLVILNRTEQGPQLARFRSIFRYQDTNHTQRQYRTYSLSELRFAERSCSRQKIKAAVN